GYLPDAVVNYLVLLGWSLDDRTELLTREQMIQNFSLERVSPSPASFDPTKLGAFQASYMKSVPLPEKVRRGGARPPRPGRPAPGGGGAVPPRGPGRGG